MNLIFTSFFLGLAGFDIAGAIIIITALSMKCSKKQIYIFAFTSLISTIIVGLLSAKVLGTGINYFADLFKYIPDNIYAIIEIGIGIALFYWFIERVFINNKYKQKEEKKENIIIKFVKKGLFIVGILFSLWAVSDPSFWGVVALATQNNNLIIVTLAFTIWMIVGQLPLYVLTIAIFFNKHEKIINWFDEKIKKNKKIEKIKKVLKIMISIIILIASIYFIVDSVFYFVRGVWLF